VVGAAVSGHPSTRMAVGRVRRVTGIVTQLGWATAGMAVTGAGLGWWLGWRELQLLALVCVLVLLLAVRYTFGRAELAIELAMPRRRVVVGELDDDGRPAVPGTMLVRNVARRALEPIRIELPVGGPRLLGFDLPRIGAGRAEQTTFAVSTARRGVCVVGPATSVRTDPLGLLRRASTWTESLEVFVHPVTVPVDPLSAGLLRDLEGQTTNDLSMNDVAFHALREYVPGDDLRHVHAFTSARVGRLMVRQFVDTRTAHVCVIVSGAAREYRGEDEFEMAISAGASVAMRGLRDRQQVSVVAAGHSTTIAVRRPSRLVLDTFARAEYGAPHSDLVRLARHSTRVAPDTSLAVLVTGGVLTLADLRAAAARFGPDVRVMAIRVATGGTPAVQRVGSLDVLTVPGLEHLRQVLRKVGS
jgi:uncharacterized protein (DUF58 family)